MSQYEPWYRASMDDRFLTAQEAAAELGISLATLYAYASRGMLHSEPVPGAPRAKRYPRQDVLRLKEKKELRREPEKAAPKALSWGMPVLESALTLIQDGRLYYRGRDAVELARTSTVEEVAALLWTGDPEEAGRLVSGAALILAADHELNVSAFTARCVASANASPWDVVSAGLAALKGSRHGGHTERVEALFREAGTAEEARRVLADRLRRGEPIPGCGHTLYPDGDPRGAALLEMAREIAPESLEVELALAMAEAYRELIHEHPTIDHGLVALSRALELPERTPIALFALGRTIGWIGH